MSIYPIDYTGNPVTRTARVDSPIQAARFIIDGFIPDNLFLLTSKSDAFREATLATLLTKAAEENKFEDVLTTLTKCMQESPDGTVMLRIFSEYAAAVAFAWEHQELAARIIMRNDPQQTSPFLWTIVSAIKKNMPSVMFAAMVMSSLDDALNRWQNDAPLFGITTAVGNLTTV